jgi:hypothetical protein
LARTGNLAMFKFLCKHSDMPPASVSDIAARYGHVNIIKYMHKHVAPWGINTSNALALYGHIDVLKYLHKSGCPCNDICQSAIIGGHLPILKWAVSVGIRCGADCTHVAARYGQLHVLKFLHKKIRPWDYQTYRAAIYSKQPEIANYLAAHGCPNK